MRRKTYRFSLFSAVLLLWAASIGLADSQNKKRKTWKFDPMSTGYIERVLDWTARAVARQYDLDKAQARVARKMLVDSAWQFINEHRPLMEELVVKMYDARLSQEEPSAEQVQQWAEKAYPIFDEARKLILEKNLQFHEILNDEQKAKHRIDLEQMQLNFEHMDERLKRWRDGQYKPGEFRQGLSDPKYRRQARKRARMLRKRLLEKELKIRPASPEFWELYVKLFIDAFQLDQGQQTLAYSILKDIKVEGVAYRTDHKRQFDKLEELVDRLSKIKNPSPAQQEQLKAARKQLSDLYKPMMEYFEELKVRLMDIPTAAQREAARQILGQPKSPQTQATKPAATKAATTTPTALQPRLIK